MARSGGVGYPAPNSPKKNKRGRQDQIKDNIKGGQKKGQGKKPGQQQRGQGPNVPPPLTKVLDPREAHKMAMQEARAEYGPTIRAAKSEIAGSRNRQKQINEWFQGLGNQIGESAQATDQSYAQANNALLAHAQAAANAAQATQGQVAAGNQAMIGLTGADASLTAPIEAEQAGAANQRQIANQILAAPIAQAGASQAGYLRNTGINARREGIQQKGQESKRRLKIKQDLTALRGERAAKGVANFGRIRGEERDYLTQRAAFGLDKKTAALDAAQAKADAAQKAQENAADLGIAQQNANTAARGAKRGEEEFEYEKKHPDKEEKGGLTPSEERGIKQGKQNAAVTAKNLYTAATKKPQTDAEWAAFAALVAQEEEISPTEAQIAVKKLRKRVESGPGADVNGPGLGR